MTIPVPGRLMARPTDTADSCPTCGGSGYVGDGGDCVVQCDDPDCGYWLLRDGERLVTQMPDYEPAKTDWVKANGPHWTDRDRRALWVYFRSLPKPTPAQVIAWRKRDPEWRSA